MEEGEEEEGVGGPGGGRARRGADRRASQGPAPAPEALEGPAGPLRCRASPPSNIG